MTRGVANWLDLLTAASGAKNGTSFSGTYTYDGAGNPTSFFNVGDLSTWTMTWKNGRELATASDHRGRFSVLPERSFSQRECVPRWRVFPWKEFSMTHEAI